VLKELGKGEGKGEGCALAREFFDYSRQGCLRSQGRGLYAELELWWV